MNKLLLLSILIPAAISIAQEGSPAPTNIAGREYPRVLPDRSTIFRVQAPDASKVQVQNRKDLRHDQGRGWLMVGYRTTSAFGFHYYYLVVDGVTVSDPASEAIFGVGKISSAVEVPEAAAAAHIISSTTLFVSLDYCCRGAGVGHNSAYTMGGKSIIVMHGYDKRDNGRPKLIIREMKWDRGDWPSVDLGK